jgi:hypothetical protein
MEGAGEFISIWGGQYNIVQNNSIYSAGHAGVGLYAYDGLARLSAYNQIRNNLVDQSYSEEKGLNGGGGGIYASMQSHHNLIEGNTINGIGHMPGLQRNKAGIDIACGDNTIRNNSILSYGVPDNDMHKGLFIAGTLGFGNLHADNNLFEGNYVGPGYGIAVYIGESGGSREQGCTAENNTFRSNTITAPINLLTSGSYIGRFTPVGRYLVYMGSYFSGAWPEFAGGNVFVDNVFVNDKTGMIGYYYVTGGFGIPLDQAFTRYPNVFTSTGVDTTPPTVTSFAIPATSSSFTIPITDFTATDVVGVTGYLATESPISPDATDPGWSDVPPATFTFTSEGRKRLYAWAIDEAGNVSNSPYATVVIRLPDTTAPTITAFSIPSISASREVQIQNFTASDNYGVTGYLVKESFTAPTATDAAWYPKAPTSYTFGSDGNKTLYAWVKDAAGILSQRSAASVTIDTIAPTITEFTLPATSSALVVPIQIFTASDNYGVTGYLVKESTTVPTATDSAWSPTAPSSYTFGSEGNKTLHAWVKDITGIVSIRSDASVSITLNDTTAPTITAFSVSFSNKALTLNIKSLMATDNVAVTGYNLTESATAPASTATGWTETPLASYTFACPGQNSLYAWAKDAKGNVSLSKSLTVYATNQPPTVVLTAPANGTTYTAPAAINLTATAADSDGTVSKVEFYNGATLLGTSTTAPYSYSWTSVVAGTYTLSAKSYDNLNAVATSTAATVTVKAAVVWTNVALATNGGVATASSTFNTLYPITSINDGGRMGNQWGKGNVYDSGWNDATNNVWHDWAQITFDGQKSIEEIDVYTLSDTYAKRTTDPTSTEIFTKYGCTAFDVQFWNGSAWVTVPGGNITGNNLVLRTVTFPAVTTDRIRIQVNAALADYSRITEIEAYTAGGVINRPPIVALTAPASGANYTAPATIKITASASDPDGTVSKVEFYNGSILLSTATTAPYGYTWSGVAAGSYTLTAKATDNSGTSTISPAVTVTVTAPANIPPTVTLTTPVTGTTYTAPATISLTASASDPDGTVRKVDFYNGATLLGTATTKPYSYTLKNVAIGTYTLTALAYDNLGATSISTAATVTVVAPINVALAANGGVATASSNYFNGMFPIAAVNDGGRTGKNWNNGGYDSGWNDNTRYAWPDWAQITFNGLKTIDKIDVYTLSDTYAKRTTDPTSTEIFTKNGIVAFDVQYWDGSSWVTVPGGNITGNNLVWRTVTFPAVTTDRIRIQVKSALAAYSRIIEIEAYTAGGVIN